MTTALREDRPLPAPARLPHRPVARRPAPAGVPGTADDRGAGDEVVVRLSESLLADGLADVRWLLHDALVGGARRIVVDLTGVRHLSSGALASFLWAHRTCRARGGGVLLRGADRRTREMLRRTGLWRVLRLQAGRPRGRG